MEAACPICGGSVLHARSAESATLTAAMIGPGRKVDAAAAMIRCGSCKVGFAPAAPEDEQLAGAYRDLELDPYQSERHGRERSAARQLSIVHRYVQRGRMLDVGCASGIFLKAALDSGWQVVGVEPSTSMSGQARALLGEHGSIVNSTLQEAALAPRSFDCVTLWDVLEHVAQPVEFLQRCAELLRPGGILVANVPDISSVQARILRRRWPLLLPEHLFYFNDTSLRLCGERAGLTWVGSGRRPASFSIGYVLSRMAQHQIPVTRLLSRVINRMGWQQAVVSVYIGELYGVWTR